MWVPGDPFHAVRLERKFRVGWKWIGMETRFFVFDRQKCGNPKIKMFPSKSVGDIDSIERSKTWSKN